ncbi:hypothetical protein O4N82_08070 [Vibrio parahaemolyticus]|uniref:trypco2 family protein n=1 Tax=Vibrio parahaemolyticus TaxID=670 RepID=UPI0022B43B72|nr:trypco2 family protein [Vibrio parahaemolyticus]MBE5179472.1 hypothetical protein [Vibrio parahaemolyticus]MCZ6401706.1 hypothetical protein [Vibrio parahaemolyticus]
MSKVDNADKGLSLNKFIKSLKSELIEAMYEDKDKLIFELKNAEVEIAVTTHLEANGQVKFFASGIGAKGSENYSHKVKLILFPKIYCPEPDTAPISETKNNAPSDKATRIQTNAVSRWSTTPDLQYGGIFLGVEQVQQLNQIGVHFEDGMMTVGKNTNSVEMVGQPTVGLKNDINEDPSSE